MSKNKKKQVKKSIDIEAEFIGKPVAPKKKKGKQDDLTDELRKILGNTITIDSIKYIFLRLYGPLSQFEVNRSLIQIYAFPNETRKQDEFLIFISYKRILRFTYYLTSFGLWGLCRVLGEEKLTISHLKRDVAWEIWKWLCNHPDHVNKIL